MSVCHPLFFTLAWFGTLGNYYGHIAILFCTLIFGSPVLIRLFFGQLWNILMGVLVHFILGSYFQFECIIGESSVSTAIGGATGFSSYQNPENRYINPLPFPSFDLQILYFTFIFMTISYYRDEWRLNTENKHIYYRFTSIMTMFMLITTLFYLWFHSLVQILFSTALGSVLGMVWHKLTIRVFHTLQPSHAYIYPNSSTMDAGPESLHRTRHIDSVVEKSSMAVLTSDHSEKEDNNFVSVPLESPRSPRSSSAASSYLRSNANV